jgi:hypothetical protein
MGIIAYSDYKQTKELQGYNLCSFFLEEKG